MVVIRYRLSRYPIKAIFFAGYSELPRLLEGSIGAQPKLGKYTSGQRWKMPLSVEASSPRMTTEPTYRAGSPAARHKAMNTNEYSEQEPLPR